MGEKDRLINNGRQSKKQLPLQVPLSFDEAAMEVLEWLNDAPFEGDMYVDLPANCIRYCFRTMLDAAAFKQRFADGSTKRRAVSGVH